MRIAAIYELPVPIWIATDVLGERITTGFGSVTFDILMPSIGGAIGVPPALEGVNIPSLKSQSAELLVWIQRFAAFTPGADADSAALCRVVVQTHEAKAVDCASSDLALVIESWFDAVRTWVETITGQDLDPNHRVYTATDHGANLTFIDPASTNGGPVALSITTPRITPVPAKAWRRILRAIAAGEEPPLEEQLSRDFRAAFFRGQLRRSVIDAASAAELVISSLIRENVSADDLPDQKLRKNLKALDKQPLGGLVTLARAAGLDLGVDFNDLKDLTDLRNDAIHRARAPKSSQALRVTQAVIDLLAIHGPWRRAATLPEGYSE